MQLKGFKTDEYDLVIYGSTANGLALRNDADLDLSLMIPKINKVEEIKSTIVQILKVINNDDSFRERYNVKVINATFG